MAVVWKAMACGDRDFARPVAVKRMHSHLSEQPVFIDMFVEEARVGASLLHSADIAQAYDFVAENGGFYLVMEWIEGIDLGTYVRRFKARSIATRWELIAIVGVSVLRALVAAHERTIANDTPSPILHRDVSPHNILITPQGVVKLIDFGLCLAHDRPPLEWTQPGIVKGKMAYLARRLLRGKDPTCVLISFLQEQYCGRL